MAILIVRRCFYCDEIFEQYAGRSGSGRKYCKDECRRAGRKTKSLETTPGELRAALQTLPAPRWTDAGARERSEGRAARVAALYLLTREHSLPDVPKTEIARRLGISRWTLDRDLASVREVDAQIAAVLAAITE